MGGSVGFADLDTGIGICILKTAYTPTTLRGTTMSPGMARVISAVRGVLDPTSQAQMA